MTFNVATVRQAHGFSVCLGDCGFFGGMVLLRFCGAPKLITNRLSSIYGSYFIISSAP